MNGTILYQFVGSPNDPLTEETILKFFIYSKRAVKSFMSDDRKSFIKDPDYAEKIKQLLGTIKDINVTAIELLRRLDSSKIEASAREEFKEQIAAVVQDTNEIIHIRSKLR